MLVVDCLEAILYRPTRVILWATAPPEMPPPWLSYAAGFPAGIADKFTLTKGIISKDAFPSSTAWASVDRVIEHDARIRGGSSGGPLVDGEGRIVGINFAGIDTLDYNFAIDRDTARPTVARLVAGESNDDIGITGKVWRPTDQDPYAVWVSAVGTNSLADRAGIRQGDTIQAIGGRELGQDPTLKTYCDVIRANGLSAPMDLRVYRPTTHETLVGQLNGEPLAPSDPAPAGYRTVRDDSGRLSVWAPELWDELDRDPMAGASDGWVALAAAPDLDSFGSSYDATGLWISASAESDSSPEDLLAEASQPIDDVCQSERAKAGYRSAGRSGFYSMWTCGTTTRVVVLAITDTDGARFLISIQLPDDEVATETINTIAESVTFTPEG